MPQHEYSARQALDLILEKIKERYPVIHERVKGAIDAGQEVQATQQLPLQAERSYRKNEPYTDEQALAVLLSMLEAHLVEAQQLIMAAHSEFKHAENSAPILNTQTSNRDWGTAGERRQGKNTDKIIEIETEPETVLEKQDLPNINLVSISKEHLEEIKELLKKLRAMVTYV